MVWHSGISSTTSALQLKLTMFLVRGDNLMLGLEGLDKNTEMQLTNNDDETAYVSKSFKDEWFVVNTMLVTLKRFGFVIKDNYRFNWKYIEEYSLKCLEERNEDKIMISPNSSITL